MARITIDNADLARLKMLRNEYNKDQLPLEKEKGDRPMTLANAVQYVLDGYERGMYIIEPGMFDPDREI